LPIGRQQAHSGGQRRRQRQGEGRRFRQPLGGQGQAEQIAVTGLGREQRARFVGGALLAAIAAFRPQDSFTL